MIYLYLGFSYSNWETLPYNIYTHISLNATIIIFIRSINLASVFLPSTNIDVFSSIDELMESGRIRSNAANVLPPWDPLLHVYLQIPYNILIRIAPTSVLNLVEKFHEYCANYDPFPEYRSDCVETDDLKDDPLLYLYLQIPHRILERIAPAYVSNFVKKYNEEEADEICAISLHHLRESQNNMDHSFFTTSPADYFIGLH